MPLPTLCVVPHNMSILGPVLTPLVPRLFSQMVHGNTAADFAALRGPAVTDAAAADLVVLFGGSGSCDVLAELCSWRRAHNGARCVTWAHTYFTGLDAFNLKGIAAEIDGVPISNARDVFSSMLAEHVMLAQLYFNRQVWKMQQLRADRTWDRYPCIESRRQRLGIIGYGGIGKFVARSASAGFDMEVLGLRTAAAGQDELGTTIVGGDEGLEQILTTCDFVVAVLPLTPQTRHMLKLEHFRKMKKNAVFVNIGRGATIVEDDLVTAIEEGSIKGAALDVFEEEPLPPSSSLWRVPDDKMLLSSHNADISATSYQDATRHFVREAERFVADGTLPSYLVDVQKGY
jgi:phosphoglycerate dehydrogenase-like enzyme